MRITAEARAENRQRLLDAGGKLFRAKGFDQTTTRDLAAAAGLGVGTFFNYFPSKESLGMTLLQEALAAGRARFRRRRKRALETLEEALFALGNRELAEIAKDQGYAGPVFEATLGPFAATGVCPPAERERVEHLEVVAGLLSAHGFDPGIVALQLYWTLRLGVLACWTRDLSPRGEDTRLLLDQSTRLFVRSLGAGAATSGDAS